LNHKVAIISLPRVNTPVQGILTNLNGYWHNPEILAQWAGACKIVYDDDYEEKSTRILADYTACMAEFYRDNAL